MLCLHCSAHGLAQAGCNCNYPKRHYLTLAMQPFSSNSATFHQQVHFCSARMYIEPPSVQSYATAELILQLPALEWTVPSSLIPLSPMTPPAISLAPALAWQLPAQQAKPAENHVVVLFSVCQPGEATGTSKPGKEKLSPFTGN